jgi:tetrathionate reductase subunit A
LTGVKRIWDKLQATLKPEEVAKAAFVLARGGRFEEAAISYEGDMIAQEQLVKPICSTLPRLHT